MQRYNDKKNERKGRSNMKTFRLRCKKLCAVVLMIVTAFGFSFATPKTAQAANTKYWIKVNKQANVATVIPVKEWNIQTDQSIPGILWRCQYTSRYILYTSQVPLADTNGTKLWAVLYKSPWRSPIPFRVVL